LRSLARSLLSIPWAYAWMVPLAIALSVDPPWATAVLLGSLWIFVLVYVIRPLRARSRLAARLQLRSCRPYLSWLTVAVGLKLLLMMSSLVLHEQLAQWRLLPRLPDDPELVAAEFLATPLGAFAFFLAIAIMAPLIEEFAFRGWMLRDLQRVVGPLPAILITGVSFSLLHGRLDAIHHIAFGVFAGWVVWRTRSIWAGVYMHALNNAAALVMMHVASDSASSSATMPPWLWPYALIVGAVALAGFVAAGARIHQLAQAERPRAGAWLSNRSPGRAIAPTI
jgi:membrane protease YdiL (CAAX protease family)